MVRLAALILPLGLDTFAVAAAAGMLGLSGRRRVGLSLLFALFEGGMPLLGLLVGGVAGLFLGGLADYVAIAALAGLGLLMLVAGEEGEERRIRSLVVASGPALLLAGLSVSLDELAIGFSLGLVRVPVLPALLLIAIQAVVVSQLGFALGARVRESVREGVERLAGVVLIVLAAALLAGKLLEFKF